MSEDRNEQAKEVGAVGDSFPDTTRALLMLVGAQEVLLEVTAAVTERPDSAERAEAFEIAESQVEALRVLAQRELSGDTYGSSTGAAKDGSSSAASAASWSGEEHSLSEWVHQAFHGPDLHDAVPLFTTPDAPAATVVTAGAVCAYCAAPVTREGYGWEHAEG